MKKTILFFSLFCVIGMNAQETCLVGSSEPLYLPDDQSQFFSTTVEMTSGFDGATINSVDDIISVWVNMEHSFVGDLIITLRCPNGQYTNFHEMGGGGAFLGIPEETDSGIPGIGWDYWWSPTPEYGTFAEEGDGGATTLPSGVYESADLWEDLYGCPVNGDWTLEIYDMWGSDDGYLFGWGIAFNQNLIDGECQGLGVPGCTDESACNYNPNATEDNGSCLVPECGDWNACNYNPNTLCEDNSLCTYYGCIDPNACNYDPEAGCDDTWSCVFPGCTDDEASNYNPSAGCDDGSCIYVEFGCTDEFACNYDPEALGGGWCDYESCVTIEFIWLDYEYLCDTTVVSFYVTNIEPNYAGFYLYNSMNQDDLIISLSEGVTYEIPFTVVDDITQIEDLPLFLEMGPFSGQNFFDVWDWYPVEIDVSLTEPDIIQIDENTYYCTNCEEQEADMIVWALTDLNDNQYVFEDSSVLFVPEDFEGTLEMCLFNIPAGCFACAEIITISNGIEEKEEQNLQILSNGSSPLIVPQKGERLRIFDGGGRIVFDVFVQQGQSIETNRLSNGIYEILFGEETYRIVISR